MRACPFTILTNFHSIVLESYGRYMKVTTQNSKVCCRGFQKSHFMGAIAILGGIPHRWQPPPFRNLYVRAWLLDIAVGSTRNCQDNDKLVRRRQSAASWNYLILHIVSQSHRNYTASQWRNYPMGVMDVSKAGRSVGGDKNAANQTSSLRKKKNEYLV